MTIDQTSPRSPATHGTFELPPLWKDLIPPALTEALSTHPLLEQCRRGVLPIETIRSFLIQHQYYSQYFTRYLCALMANLPSRGDVRALAENLCEEMGLDEPGAVTHAELYIESMRACGTEPGAEPMLPETKEMVDTMFNYCRSRDALHGLSALCLGAEAIVPVVYQAILDGLRQASISARGLYFFELHVAEDEQHAIVMRQIIDRLLEAKPYIRPNVIAIGEDMIRLRMAVFDGILRSRSRTAATS